MTNISAGSDYLRGIGILFAISEFRIRSQYFSGTSDALRTLGGIASKNFTSFFGVKRLQWIRNCHRVRDLLFQTPREASMADPTAPADYSKIQTRLNITDTTPMIALLIPCYSEGFTVRNVLAQFRRNSPVARIYVFDNHPTDHAMKKKKKESQY
jgi:hypothetical protein